MRYIKQYRKVFHTNLLTSGGYLSSIDRDAEALFSRLIEQMTKHGNITESLKATNQMAWVQRMYNIRHATQEIVLNDLIYR